MLGGLSCSSEQRRSKADGGYRQTIDELFVRASKTTFEGGYVWGRAVKGLRAAVEFTPERESYVIEEDYIQVHIRVQNVSRHDIQVAYASWGRPGANVRDMDGRDVDMNWPTIYAGSVSVRRQLLKPGEVRLFRAAGLGFVDSDDPYSYQSKAKPGFWGGSIVHSKPGQYRIVYAIDLGQELHSLVESKGVPYPGDWQGNLVAGVRTVNVVSAPDREPASDEIGELVTAPLEAAESSHGGRRQ